MPQPMKLRGSWRAGKRKDFLVICETPLIAGIVLAHGATLATTNVQHFSDLTLNIVNPWAS